MDDIANVLNALHGAERIAITAHVRPDGDAIGATLGLHRILADAGKASTIVALGPIPDRYAFLLREDIIIPAEQTTPEQFDLLTILDTGAIDRMPELLQPWLTKVRTLNIDHHPTNTAFADINYVVPTASSVGEIICALANANNLDISKNAAEALWVALVTDTGRFSFSNTTPAAMQAASRLLETGIKTDHINHRIYNAIPLVRLQLQGRAIEHIEIHHQGQLALVSLSRKDFSAYNARGEDAEDIVDIPRSIHGVQIALFLYELPGDGPIQTKASFRTNEPFDAAELCRSLKGGGHARAAGCSIDLPLAEAKKQMLSVIDNLWFKSL